MVEALQQTPPQSFTTIKYTTKDGEHISATKNNGIVTLVGDKNGTRQMPLDDFVKKELATNLANVQLEKEPQKDTVEISKTAAKPEADKATEKKDIDKAQAKTPEKTNETKPEEKKLDVTV